MTLIGLTGTHGAGKGTVVSYLTKEFGFQHISVSDFLAEEALRQGMTEDRGVRAALANSYREQSPTALMRAVLSWGQDKYPNAEQLVLEPQYTVAEVEYIKQNDGIVIAVDADIDVRYARIQGRGSAKDNVTYEEFVAHQKKEMHSDDPNRWNLGDTIERADYKIQNNGGKRELHAQIADILTKARKEETESS